MRNRPEVSATAFVRRRFDAHVSIGEGKFGQFDVCMDGEIVASRGRTFLRRMLTHGAPSREDVLETIGRHLAVKTGNACELPPNDER